MGATADIELDGQYRALREEAARLRRPRGFVTVHGPQGAEYLQGQITNDVEALGDGEGCYAALLDRKGHMRADLRVLRIGPEELWLDTEPEALEALLAHLRTFLIGFDARVADASAERALVSVIGPATEGLLGQRTPDAEHASTQLQVDGIACRAVGAHLGADFLCAANDVEVLEAALETREIVAVTEPAVEILRVEAGRPRYGREMTDRTIPQEAGINERAVSFTKGCYVGQETVARLHYKGKPNRTLRGLRFAEPAMAGEPLVLGDREVGEIGTACLSPVLGAIGLAIVRREAEPGSELTIGAGSRTAEVVQLPFPRPG
ncbi:MAG: YgfZ/GcvT domain-containing protein [Solirubrobacterales bacterium]